MPGGAGVVDRVNASIATTLTNANAVSATTVTLSFERLLVFIPIPSRTDPSSHRDPLAGD